MTKKQKVTITIVGPLVLCLSLVLILVCPFLTTRRDTDPQKSASGQSPIVAQAIVAASVGQAVVAQSSPGSPAVLPVSTLLPIIPGSTGFGSQCWNSTCGIFNCPTPGGTPIALGSPPQFNPTTGVNLNTFTSPSFVENQTMNYHHIAVDYSAAGGSASGGCAPCGNAGSPNNGANLPTLEIGRRHRYRDMTEVSSFGPGVFLNYDTKLHFSSTTVEIFDPQLTLPRLLSDNNSDGVYDHWFGSAGIGGGAELGCSIQLQDSTGTPVTGVASAARAVLTNRVKNTFTFGLFQTSPGSGTYGGRLTEIAD